MIGNQKEFRIPHSYLTNKIKIYCSQDLVKGLNSTKLNKTSRILLKKLAISSNFNLQRISKEIIKLNPIDISIITKVLSGHNILNYHLYNMGYSYHTYCEYCTEPESQNIDNDTAEIKTASHNIYYASVLHLLPSE